MNRIPRPLRAALAGSAALSLVAGGVALLAVSAAQAAGPTVDLAIAPSSQRVSAGTCALFTITPLSADRLQASDTQTVTIRLTENPNSGTQDVDFCAIPGQTDAPSTAPFYENGIPDPENDDPFDPGAARMRQTYQPGPSITPDVNGLNSGGTPDSASSTDAPTPSSNTNPSGMDYAQFKYQGDTIQFGVVGLIPGGANIDAWIDKNGNEFDPPAPSPGEITAQRATATFSSGGLPGGSAAADAVASLDAEPEDGAAPPGTLQLFTATVRNGVGDTVAGVRPSILVQSGPNSAAAKQVRADCGLSNNSGVANCAWQGTDAGVDTLRVFVNKSNGTGAWDANEAYDDIVRTTTGATNTNASAARYVDLVPDAATTTAGSSRDFTAIVTDVAGNPVQGVVVTFTESGPGTFSGGASPRTVTTNSAGRAVITATSTANESGAQTITATLPSTSQCGQPAGSPAGSTAGRCSDSAANTIAAAGASPSATPTASISPSASPSPTSSAGCRTAVTTVNTKTINATGLASVTVSGVQPNSRVELQGYSQNHYGTANFGNDTTNPDRTGTASSSGTVTFNDLRPGSNTRLRARQVGCGYGGSDTINVRTQLSLQVTRIGTRQYRFDVDSIPARPSGLIVSIYRITGTSCGAGVEPRNCPGETFVGQTRVSAVNGAGRVTFTFDRTYPAREQFVLKTGQDAQNFPGRSNVRDLAIF